MPHPTAKTYLLVTYGCQMNVADSERIAGALESTGLTPAASEREADVLVVNTCMVRRKPEEKALRRLNEFAALKRPDGLPSSSPDA
jgi:tRNA-2-methylthio-N6-dimethylallyladenosine synthase